MPHLPRAQLVVLAVAGIVVLAVAGRWLAQAGAGRAAPAPSAGPAGGEGPVVEEARGRGTLVHVAGAVRRPGVYRLAPDARVRDAVRRAGGPTGRADVNAVNLAALVSDGVQVVVPRRVAAAGGPGTASTAAAADAPAPPVNLNSATPEQLDELDGIGPVTAAKILEYRTQHGGFRSVEDLGQVPGIGPKTLEGLRDHVTV